ncbi:MAG: hypothetical protein AB1345_05055 [Chloroflexota bacterium]
MSVDGGGGTVWLAAVVGEYCLSGAASVAAKSSPTGTGLRVNALSINRSVIVGKLHASAAKRAMTETLIARIIWVYMVTFLGHLDHDRRDLHKVGPRAQRLHNQPGRI